MERLRKVQSELKAPKSQYNSFGKYNYRNSEDILEAVKPLLLKHQLTMVISDEIIQVSDRIYVKATVDLFHENEKISVSAYAREPQSKKGMDESQITGATSSYARKYALNGMFCIDDTKDADSMNNTKEPSKKESTKKETIWLTDEQFNKAINSDKKGIEATLKAFSVNGKAMKKEYKEKLETKLKTFQNGSN
jgi:hypothetical protein